jgi:hypothetical protein
VALLLHPAADSVVRPAAQMVALAAACQARYIIVPVFFPQ